TRVADRARAALVAAQHPDGRFDFEADIGPVCTAHVVAPLAWAGRLAAGDAGAAARFLRAEQRDDGSFPLYPRAPAGDRGATASARDPLARRAARWWLDGFDLFTNIDGSFNCHATITASFVGVLHALGEGGGRMGRAVEWLGTRRRADGDRLRFSVYSTEVWS